MYIFQQFTNVYFSAVYRADGAGKQQFFRTTPQDSFVPEGGRAIINCVIGDLAGRVQWTKDGLTLGECPSFAYFASYRPSLPHYH